MNIWGWELADWVVAAMLAALMVLAWLAGWKYGAWWTAQGKPRSTTLNEPILALFGLLLGFTFSMALSKHDQRRQKLVADSSAIGDFSTCVDMLVEPHRGKMLQQIRDYLQSLLTPLNNTADEVAVSRKLDELQAMQSALQKMIREAIQDKPVVTVPLVNTFNALTSAHAARLATLRDRLPWSVMMLLSLAALVTMLLQGRRQGEDGNRNMIPTLGFVILISMIIWVILDLNQPGRGSITISNEPLVRLLGSLQQ